MLRLSSNYFKLFMKLNKVIYGRGLKLIGLPVIYKSRKAQIQIGRNCTIKSDFLSNLIGLYQRSIIVAREDGIINIGDSVGISGATIYSRQGIYIGDNTNIGGNVKILDHDFHPVDPVARLNDDQSMTKRKEIRIGKNVFIGCNSIILKGTILGDNCVVGAGSVVCGRFPSNVIILGNPARVIKEIRSEELG